MRRALLAVFMSGLLTAACVAPSLAQAEELVLIRDGFVVPSGKLLLVDDMSVDCVIASEVFDEAVSGWRSSARCSGPTPGAPG